jgi:hypothetical protein
MEQALTDEQLISLLDVLEEGDKLFTQASYRDLMMTAHTDTFFELGVRDVVTMDAGWASFKGLQNNFQGKLMSVYGKFQAGTMTTGAATTEFQNLLKKFSKDAFMAGTQMVGNKYYKEVGMTKKDLAFINKYVRTETRHFRKFLNDIKDPKHLPANRIPRDKLGRRLPGYRQQIHPYAGTGQAFRPEVASLRGLHNDCRWKSLFVADSADHSASWGYSMFVSLLLWFRVPTKKRKGQRVRYSRFRFNSRFNSAWSLGENF